ncbi:Putative uncharacterized protein OS=Cellulomonas fimi (strain ATCC 484 / DSM 20113 / JCM 1341 / NBRC 15513 / NCIMB 8980 / NCTC 7547) GN=Celf_0266 PE=4 SV=1 [Gemmata massiliana]|uniref:Peptidase S1 domain-containing protein n=1 Tax=Gemmata massiliana TaxID=1210884 RepID=A0A6P2DL89_9BACT|nr:hypothetical protein [Gemmata massiliana]VTS03286.1 Putative uncharacterized protein OS=Cellulomonas fimi (strain ATCC 484 / DSM 20113 / JCM 1341 / NBRC 15513 / NCIMB 8980 / NCTC 7547) GN=Celf_0266 PE=4 SV=1 [Gemmata massiliana]
MNRESANALKSEILATVYDRFGPSAVAQGVGAPEPATPLLAVGIEATSTGIARTFRPAVRVQKRFLRDLPELIEKKRKGQIDLRFVGEIVAQAPWNRGRNRPLEPGVSVGHYTGPTGTLGCFVSKADDPTFIGALSCQHVLSQLLAGAPGPTEFTIQPGLADEGHWINDRIGSVAVTVPLPNTAGYQIDGRSTLDCAVARVDPTLATGNRNVLRGIGPITGTVADLVPYLGTRSEPVRKLGRTTGLTTGVVTALDLDEIVVTYREGSQMKKVAFTGVFEIEELNGRLFSDGGDSGSVIVDRRGLVLGLLFAGSKRGGTNNRSRTFAIPIAPVLTALGVAISLGPTTTPTASTRSA